MSRPYRLLLLSLRKPERIEECHCSNHMIAWGLWAALQRLPHITLDHRECNTVWSEPPHADALLVHAYFGNEVFTQVASGHYAGVRHKMQIGEHPAAGFDRCYTFLPHPDCTYFPCPCLTALTAPPDAGRVGGSLLLDHIWPDQTAWATRLYDWLAGYSYPVGQLRRSVAYPERPDDDKYDQAWPYPDWIRAIPESGYLEYLRMTESYETFIVTHSGSYEHSVVDMAARGMRVLVPVEDGRPLIHPALIRHLNLQTFSTQDELLALLAEPHRSDANRLDHVTDLSAIAAVIDTDCQRALR